MTLEAAYGTEEARRQHALENHTAESLINIIKDEKLEATVDFVASGHVTLFLVDKEFEDARADYAAAEAAGVDLSGIEWLDKDAMQAVSYSKSDIEVVGSSLHPTGVRDIIPRGSVYWEKPLASKARYGALQACVHPKPLQICSSTLHQYPCYSGYPRSRPRTSLEGVDTTWGNRMFIRDPCDQCVRELSLATYAWPGRNCTCTRPSHGVTRQGNIFRSHENVMVEQPRIRILVSSPFERHRGMPADNIRWWPRDPLKL